MTIKPIKTERDYRKALKEIENLWDTKPNTSMGTSTTLIGRPRTALSNCGKAEVAFPGPRLPSLTGRLAADHSSRFFIPVFSVRTQVCRSGAGVPSQPEFLAIKHHALVSEYMLENHRPREMANR